ncbi:MAG: 50S ribosomal protein L6 [Methanomassiliicoccales archaeon]|nr:MAG: 50S ribosomal protein L6 [Methanomassiliicoccales archaeon]
MPVSPKITKNVAIPPNVQVKLKDTTLFVKGPKGTLSRTFSHPRISVKISKENVVIRSLMPKRKENALVGTWEAHISNMFKGVTKGYRYTMKVVYSHFPVKTILKGDEFIVENFLGESHPRKAKVVGNTKVEIKGDTITLMGINLEEVSQTCANIELATKIRNYDPRVFQDGIYMVEKGIIEEAGD